MALGKRWAIPSDWNEEQDGWRLVLFCVPDSLKWRGLITGHIYELTYGRNWDERTGTILDVLPIAREICESMDMNCTESLVTALAGIQSEIAKLGDNIKACCESKGQELDDPPHDGVVSVGQPGDQFATELEYITAKCATANGIYDTILNTVSWLKDNNVDLIAGVYGGAGVTLVGVLLAAGPPGWAIAGVGVAVAGIMLSLVSATGVNFSDLEDALTEQHEDLVCALYSATNAQNVKTAFLDTLEEAATPLTSIETGLISVMFPYKLANQLFEPRDDVAAYESPDPIACSCGATRIFVEDNEGSPGGVIVGSDLFADTDDVVIVDSQPDQYAGCHIVYVTVRTGVVQTDVNLSISVDGWSSFAALPCNVEVSFAYGDDFDPLVQSWSSSTEPATAGINNVAIVALRSGSAFTATFTRLA